MSKIDVSVIIPVYNAERFLQDCLTSVEQQTLPSIEIICINDGSTDTSGAIIEAAMREDQRIRVVHQQNKGMTLAREQGVHISQGEYIYFLDSDDLIHLQALALLHQAANTEQADLVCHRHQNVAESAGLELTRKPLKAGSTRQVSADKGIESKKISIFSCAKLYKRTLFDNFNFPAVAFAEDLYCTPIIAFKANKILVLKHKLYFYRQHSASVTGHFSQSKLDAVFDQGISMLVQLNNQGYPQQSIARLRRYVAYYQLFSIVTLLLKNDKIAHLRTLFIQRWKQQDEVSLSDLKGIKRLIMSQLVNNQVESAQCWLSLYTKLKL
jgi:glycosyltransferase involved in cell wall biosynthesis